MQKNSQKKLNELTQRIKLKIYNRKQQKIMNFNILNKRYQDFKNFCNDARTQKVVRLSSGIAEKIVPFLTKPKFSTLLTTTIGIAQVFADEYIFYADDFFTPRKWETFSTDALNNLLLESISDSGLPITTIKGLDKDVLIKIVSLPQTEIGWQLRHGKEVNDINFLIGTREEVYKLINNYVWTKWGSKPLLLERKTSFKNNSAEPNESELSFKFDNLVAPLPSKKASDIANRFTKAFAVNENRSLMLVGPPGSGKSTMARQIATELSLHTFRVKVSDLNNHADSLYEIVDIIKPEVIILDDFDRDCGSSYLLDVISYIRQNVKLLIATVNNSDVIDDALLRPGRFDEIEYIDTINDEVILDILGPEHSQLFDDVKTWPVVYIQELKRRLKWLSEEDAKCSLLELAERVNKIKSYTFKENNLSQLHSDNATTPPRRRGGSSRSPRCETTL